MAPISVRFIREVLLAGLTPSRQVSLKFLCGLDALVFQRPAATLVLGVLRVRGLPLDGASVGFPLTFLTALCIGAVGAPVPELATLGTRRTRRLPLSGKLLGLGLASTSFALLWLLLPSFLGWVGGVFRGTLRLLPPTAKPVSSRSRHVDVSICLGRRGLGIVVVIRLEERNRRWILTRGAGE